MKKYFSVGEAAKAAQMTSETLRHYDRIGLVKPSKKDQWTNYRYYTEQDIVRLNTVKALQMMDLPLRQIKEVLEYDDLGKLSIFYPGQSGKPMKKSPPSNTANPKSSWPKLTMKKSCRKSSSEAVPLSRNSPPASFCSRIPWKRRPLTISGIISATFTTGFPHP